jgi:hypothetical protein
VAVRRPQSLRNCCSDAIEKAATAKSAAAAQPTPDANAKTAVDAQA